MTERGLPIVDAATACPFVAFVDDRDERATSPDHRHRCYAEVRPAPRALAHQDAYCLSSAFPVCPTFQDWARREAARTRPGEGSVPPGAAEPGGFGSAAGAGDAAGAVGGGGPLGAAGTAASGEPVEPEEPLGYAADQVVEGRSRGRDGRRGWAAPPPWLTRSEPDPRADNEELTPIPPKSAGLSGSTADRLADSPSRGDESVTWRDDARWDDELEGDDELDEEDEDWASSDAGRRGIASSSTIGPGERNRPRRSREDRQSSDARRDDPSRAEVDAPSWERPRRLEVYPSLRSRRLPEIGASPLILGLAALLLAAVALFVLPGFLGFGGPPAGATASPSSSTGAGATVTPSTSVGPTEVALPTQQTYVVKSGDTMSRIARLFGVPLATLIEVNKEAIPNPNQLQVGQRVIIPSTTPTSLPDAGSSPTP